MVLNLTRSNDYTNSALVQVNNELRATIDFEMQKLKEQEKQLQDALRLKTRMDLITTMERELQMEDLNDVDLGLLQSNSNLRRTMQTDNLFQRTSLSNTNLSNSNNMNTSNLDEMIRLSDDSLTKSYLLMNKLNRSSSQNYNNPTNDECSICEYPTNNSPLNTSEFLKNTVYSTTNTTKNPLSYYNVADPVRPNVIFAKNAKTSWKPQEPSRNAKMYLKPSNQNLNKQQTLVYDQNFGASSSLPRTRSETDLNRYTINRSASRPANALSLSNNYNTYTYGNSLRQSRNLNNSISRLGSNSYIRLPIGKTLIHNKAWTPGKVETNYYPYRDAKLNRDHKF